MPRRKFKKIDPAQLNSLYQNLVFKKQEVNKKLPKYDPAEHKDKTRSRIALLFVIAYVVSIALVFILTLGYNLLLIAANKDKTLLLEPKDAILIVTSSIGTSVGFVVGYYFKGEENK